MSKKTQQLFQASDVAYNDPEMAEHPEIRQQLLEAAKDLNRGPFPGMCYSITYSHLPR